MESQGVELSVLDGHRRASFTDFGDGKSFPEKLWTSVQQSSVRPPTRYRDGHQGHAGYQVDTDLFSCPEKLASFLANR